MVSRVSFVLAGTLALASIAPVPARAEDLPVEQQLVEVMNKLFGVHKGNRANHAKGIVVEGRFVARPEAAQLSTSPLFSGQPVPVTVRFSDATGIPNIPDGDGN